MSISDLDERDHATVVRSDGRIKIEMDITEQEYDLLLGILDTVGAWPSKGLRALLVGDDVRRATRNEIYNAEQRGA